MVKDNILKARNTAKEFIKRCDNCINELNASDFPRGYICGTLKSGALRRQSLELTRTLTEMRK